MDRKVDKLKADNNKAEKGGNWPVFDFCNQFLQTSQELTEATLDLLTRLAGDGVVYAEIRWVMSSYSITFQGFTILNITFIITIF